MNKMALIIDDMRLLTELYSIYAPTGHEWPMICFVRDYIKQYISSATVEMDSWGNLYIVKGVAPNGYPTLCCHLDQAQKTHSEDFQVRDVNGVLTGWSPSRQAQEGLGADDKNGIWACLQALKRCDCLKVFMSVGEEKGCWGSNRANMSFFADCLYILEPDCKGGEEIRTRLKGVPCASTQFEEALDAASFGYIFTEGKTTDILPLTLSGIGVSCANIPVGYHNPHKDDEYCVTEELTRCLDFVIHTINTLRRRFPHRYKTDTQLEVEKEQYCIVANRVKE